MAVVAPEPLITVSSVYNSSKWYQEVLGCTSRWGGLEDDPDHPYDCIVSGDTVVVQLHARDEDEHSFLREAGPDSHGQGACLYLRVDDVQEIAERAARAGARVLGPPQMNDGPGWLELELMDPDGYYVTVYEPK